MMDVTSATNSGPEAFFDSTRGFQSWCRKFSSNIYWRSSGRGDYRETTFATPKQNPWCWWTHIIWCIQFWETHALNPWILDLKALRKLNFSGTQTNRKKNHPVYPFLRFWGKIKMDGWKTWRDHRSSWLPWDVAAKRSGLVYHWYYVCRWLGSKGYRWIMVDKRRWNWRRPHILDVCKQQTFIFLISSGLFSDFPSFLNLILFI